MDTLQKSIQELISKENPKTPLTDQDMADLLKVNRIQVTLARKSAGIADSRERMHPLLISEITRLLSHRPHLSDRELTGLLNADGFRVSRFTVGNIRKEIDETPNTRRETAPSSKAPAEMPPATRPPRPAPGVPAGHLSHVAAFDGAHGPTPPLRASRENSDKRDPFSNLLGAQGSLKPLIQQAKAAILYPPHGLHTLILGPSGVGKNELAEAMYRFAQEVRGQGTPIPFVSFNCADYAENPQLLLSQLFGYVKGAYTGAEAGKTGLVEKADGGMLFLDEVHRLPAEGQEILFHLMDRGRFRRLGETETERQANVTLIAATTEDPESTLLVTFRRRIPMVVELPALADRPLSERSEMIRHFFREEAARTATTIRLVSEASQAFLLYHCPGNVGQLKSDIQVACARGFLVHMSEGTEEVVIDASKLPNYVRRGLLKLSSRRQETDRLIPGDLVIPPSTEVQVTEKEDLYTLPGEIYQFIEQRYEALREAGLGDSEVNKILGAELEKQFRQHIKRVEEQPQPVTRDDLVRLVGREMVETVAAMIEEASGDFPSLDQHLFYCLAIHLSAAVERLRRGKPILNPHLDEVKKEYPQEFALACRMLARTEERMGYRFPEDEAGFLAMYLRGSLTKDAESKESKVGVVVMTHGRVASGMVDVAARLLGANHAKWIEMSLDEDPESALLRATEMVKDVNEGKGVLLLVDMGSLLTFGEIITEQAGIPTRTLARVDTIMVLEAVRRAALPGETLDQLADTLTGMGGSLAHGQKLDAGARKKAIVTLCLTGEGTALSLKGLLEKLTGSDDVEVIPLGAAGRVDVTKRIDDLTRDRHVVAVVGTVDPGHPTVPFIPVEDIIGSSGASVVRKVLNQWDSVSIDRLLTEDLLVPQANWSTRDEVLDGCARLLLNGGYVTQAFVTDVYRRELAGATVLEGAVAIPHGDPRYVQEPAAAVVTLAKPVDWGGTKVRLVCMLALGSVGKETFLKLYRVLQPGKHLERLKAATSRDEMKRIILNGINQK